MNPPSPSAGAPTIEVVPVAWLDAGDAVTEHDPALSDEELATGDWRTVETIARRVVSCRVDLVFTDGSTATGYPEQLVVRRVGGAS